MFVGFGFGFGAEAGQDFDLQGLLGKGSDVQAKPSFQLPAYNLRRFSINAIEDDLGSNPQGC